MTLTKDKFRPPPDVIMPTAEDLVEIAAEADREAGAVGPSQMIRGGVVFALGAVITFVSCTAADRGELSGFYAVAYGAVLGGLADFVIGFSNWSRGRRARAKENAIVPK